MTSECNCYYVCSRGILKSCNIHSNTPISSIRQLIDYNFNELKPNSTIYVCGSAISEFISIAHQIPVNYVLVSGDCDETISYDIFDSSVNLNEFIDSPNLIHWFSQNCVISHPKITLIPIGLDYHTLSNANHEWGPKMLPTEQDKLLLLLSSTVNKRINKAYSNFHHFTKSKFGCDRIDAINQIPSNLIYYEPAKLQRLDSWINQREYAFVVSPHGNGLDCHRTWEALALGCIPIVKTSPLDILYKDLPVLIVQKWSDITQELLDTTANSYSNKNFNINKLTLKYWIDLINSYTMCQPGIENTSPCHV
jgi:hypothetical protein